MEAYDVLREICWNDYDKGYLSLLAQLTQVGDISREDFHGANDLIIKCQSKTNDGN